jgi:hypothetical protein
MSALAVQKSRCTLFYSCFPGKISISAFPTAATFPIWGARGSVLRPRKMPAILTTKRPKIMTLGIYHALPAIASLFCRKSHSFMEIQAENLDMHDTLSNNVRNISSTPREIIWSCQVCHIQSILLLGMILRSQRRILFQVAHSDIAVGLHCSPRLFARSE